MAFSKFIILGASGFAGKSLTAYLTKKNINALGFSSSDLDLTRPDALRKLQPLVDRQTALIMLSGVTLDREKDSLDAFDQNMAMLSNLARFLETQAPGHLVYTSTVSVYGDDINNENLTEETPAAPTTYYGAVKLAGEALFRKAAAMQSFPLAVLRACRVYGPGIPFANYGPAQFIKSILETGKVEIYGDGKELRDQLYVEDLSRLIYETTEKKADGLFNAATGEAISFQKILTALSGIIPQPFEVVQKVRTRPLINQRFDIKKLKTAFPSFRFTSLQEGLRETVDACLKKIEL